MQPRIESGLSLDNLTIIPHAYPLSPCQVDLSTSCGTIDLTIPIISSPMDTVTGCEMAIALGKSGGLGILHRHHPDMTTYIQAVKDVASSGQRAAVAIGTSNQWQNTVPSLADAGATLIAVDAAHSDPNTAYTTIESVRKSHPDIDILSHNIVTADAASAAIDAGCTSIRIGLTSGSVNRTGKRFGVGRSLGSALIECAAIARQHDVSVVADGGIGRPAHALIALALGADAVMVGRLLAGTPQAPGRRMITDDGLLSKVYRGMSSPGVWQEKQPDSDWEAMGKKRPEGVEQTVLCTIDLHQLLAWITDTLKEAMALAGCKTIKQLWSARLELNG